MIAIHLWALEFVFCVVDKRVLIACDRIISRPSPGIMAKQGLLGEIDLIPTKFPPPRIFDERGHRGQSGHTAV